MVIAANTVNAEIAMADDKNSNIYFILDASGSMWGQVKGQNKIVIAKEVMVDLIKELPADLNVGLMVYGHRHKNDCQDVEIVSALGPLNRDQLIKMIQDINPKGMTPISLSIKKAIQELKSLKNHCSIILVSDGKETCEGDPCALTKKLKKSGIDFTMHVVGFDVDDKTTEQLECIAAAGGGDYHSASDAAKLRNALTKVIKKSVGKNLVVNGFGPDNKSISVRVNVFDPHGKKVATDAGKIVGFELPPGTYRLTVKPETMGELKKIDNVIVTEEQIARLNVVFADARIGVLLKNNSGVPVKGYARILDKASNQYADQGDIEGKSRYFTVSPGTYRVVMECSETGAKIKTDYFSLGPGDKKIIERICTKSRIGIIVKDKAGKGIVGYIRILDTATDQYAAQEDSGTKMKYFEIPPGKYKVDVECPGPDAKRIRSEPFMLEAGREITREIICR